MLECKYCYQRRIAQTKCLAQSFPLSRVERTYWRTRQHTHTHTHSQIRTYAMDYHVRTVVQHACVIDDQLDPGTEHLLWISDSIRLTAFTLVVLRVGKRLISSHCVPTVPSAGKRWASCRVVFELKCLANRPVSSSESDAGLLRGKATHLACRCEHAQGPIANAASTPRT